MPSLILESFIIYAFHATTRIIDLSIIDIRQSKADQKEQRQAIDKMACRPKKETYLNT